jgi:HK97 gp10 family phage protein
VANAEGLQFSIDVRGLKEIADRLQALDRAVQNKLARNAVAAGGRVIRNEARRRAPVNHRVQTTFGHFPGTLRKAIAYAFDRAASRPGHYVGHVYVKHGKGKRNDAFYWHMVEFGTKGHVVSVSTKKVLTAGGEFFGTSVKIPEIKAQPYMRPAAAIMKEAAVEAMRWSLLTGIAAEANR